ncbi:MAG: DHH family phosphoesterase [bacterium]|nr:DHH family phosphoesterase [bacterium]
MPLLPSTLVIGHRNPDMDAIASAIGYAWVLNQDADNGGKGFIAGRAGEINAQTAYALRRFNVEPPLLVSDVYPRLSDIAEAVAPLWSDQTLLERDSHRPLGLVTGESLFAALVSVLSSGSAEAIQSTLAATITSGLAPGSLLLNAQDMIRDVVGSLLRADPDDYIVIDSSAGEARYVGLCRRAALLAPPRQKLILVDHNEAQQAVAGVEEAELAEILDHHRLGNLATTAPIRVQVEPVGSCSTLVSEQARQRGLQFPAGIAGVLLCGILSDTLVFRSPTTTPRDEEAAVWLAAMLGLAGEKPSRDALLTAIEALGGELLAAGAGLGSRSAVSIITSDIKTYTLHNHAVGIGQVEVSSFREFEVRQGELHSALRGYAEAERLDLALLLVTDILTADSRLLTAGRAKLIAALPYPRLNDGVLDAAGVVSRKKQLLPTVTAALAS